MRVSNQVLAVSLAGVFLVAGSTRGASAGQQASTAPKLDDGALQSQIEANLKKNTILAPRHLDVDVDNAVATLTGTVRTADEKSRAGRLAAEVKGVIRVDNKIEVDPKVDQSKIDAAGEKTKSGLTKAVDATVNAAHKTKEATEKGVGKTEQGVAKAADKTANATAKAGDKVGDTSLSTRIKASFSSEPLLKDTAIDVDTSDHVVTLRGTVGSSSAKVRAEEIAGGTEGVTRVINNLVVRGA
jgi:hyperosmotically inducible protein